MRYASHPRLFDIKEMIELGELLFMYREAEKDYDDSAYAMLETLMRTVVNLIAEHKRLRENQIHQIFAISPPILRLSSWPWERDSRNLALMRKITRTMKLALKTKSNRASRVAWS